MALFSLISCSPFSRAVLHTRYHIFSFLLLLRFRCLAAIMNLTIFTVQICAHLILQRIVVLAAQPSLAATLPTSQDLAIRAPI